MDNKIEDFSQYFLEETSVLDLDLPNGDPMKYCDKQVRVHLFGPATDQYEKASQSLQREATKRAMNSVGTKNRKTKEDADSDIRFLLAITDRFENFPYPGGAEAIFRELKLKYIQDQIKEHLAELGNFFGGTKKA
ncbi:hypothetical protein [uncultured Paraglaciecola sp.]|uniref:hypothetical protein n=1 Tax=uncultured Paraglaciecola sp. TaxID=1765024 RepID=UPI00260A41C3|nr:hypothetical protein [uncultured Paraglaciecola sp.]